MLKIGRKRLPAGDRRQQILDAAEQLFIERGFERVTMGDIADALGTSRPTVYTYFASTEAILDVLFTASLERLWARLEPLLEVKHQQPGAQIIPAVFAVLVEEKSTVMLVNSGGSGAFYRQRHELLTKRLAPLVQPHLPAGGGPYLLALLVNTIESMALWAIVEEITDLDGLGQSIQTFVDGGVQAIAPHAGATTKID